MLYGPEDDNEREAGDEDGLPAFDDLDTEDHE